MLVYPKSNGVSKTQTTLLRIFFPHFLGKQTERPAIQEISKAQKSFQPSSSLFFSLPCLLRHRIKKIKSQFLQIKISLLLNLQQPTRKPLMEQKHEQILQRQHSGIWRSLRDGDFEEEEVWDVVNEKPQYNKKTKQSLAYSSSSSSSVPLSVPRPLPSASRMIPKANSSKNIHTSTYNSAIEGKVLQQSAPVNIPDWSKIYNINNNKKIQNKRVSRLQDYDFTDAAEDDDDDEQVIKHGGGNFDYEEEDEEEDDDDEYDLKLPPHEFIARRLARTQISSFSVFEGVGRTLKGRDLSKVRNAVLTKTGFLESL